MGAGTVGTPRVGAALAAVLLATPVALAQEGGVLLSFDLSQSVEVSDSDDTDPVWRFDTDLGVSLSSETRTERLALTGRTGLRYVTSDGEDEVLPADPSARLSYDRTGANSDFSANLAVSSTAIAYLRPLEDFIDEDGFFVPPEDFDDLEGEGTRLDSRLALALTLGREGPFGATISLSATDLSYRDTTAPDLVDSRRADLGVDLRFAVNRTTEAVVGLGYGVIDTEGRDRRETSNLGLDLSFAEPRGALTLSAFAARTEAGTRIGLEAGRRIDLPRGGLDVLLGATRGAAGEIDLTGRASFTRELPSGGLGVRAERSVRSTDEGERLLTSLSARYDRPLAEGLDLGLDATLIRVSDTVTDSRTDSASLGASLGYALTRDWSLNAGYRLRLQDETGAEPSTEHSLSLGIGRRFDVRY